MGRTRRVIPEGGLGGRVWMTGRMRAVHTFGPLGRPPCGTFGCGVLYALDEHGRAHPEWVTCLRCLALFRRDMTEHRAHDSTITITAAGAPGTCPHCGTACGAWPLT